MAETTNISKLIINYLTEDQYKTAKASGLINENELYVTDVQDSTTLDCFEELFTATEGQTLFILTEGTYVPNQSRLTICVNGSQQPSTAYTETSSSSFTFDSGLSAGDSVIARYVNARIVSNINLEPHKTSHYSGGTDPLTPSDIGAASSTHTHGNITNGGAVGSTPNLPIFTGTNGLLETKTIEDAKTLLGISDAFQVGDIISTARTNLGSKYLLCNGALIDPASYSQVSTILTKAAVNWTPALATGMTSPNSYYTGISNIVYNGTYYVFCVGNYDSNGIYRHFSQYSTSLNGTWTSVQLTGQGYSGYGMGKLSYENGYLVVYGGASKFFYCTDPTTTWSDSQNVFNGGSISKVTYVNGNWHFLYYNGTNYVNMYRATLPVNDSNNPSNSSLSVPAGTNLLDIQYINGQYVVLATNASGTLLYYCSTLTGTWSSKTISTETTTPQLLYLDNKYIVYSTTSISYCDTINGTYTKVNRHSDATAATTNTVYSGTNYIDFTLDDTNKNIVMYHSTSPIAPKERYPMYLTNYFGNTGIISIANNNFVMKGAQYISSAWSQSVLYKSVAETLAGLKLPTVTISNGYGYIKVEE